MFEYKSFTSGAAILDGIEFAQMVRHNQFKLEGDIIAQLAALAGKLRSVERLFLG